MATARYCPSCLSLTSASRTASLFRRTTTTSSTAAAAAHKTLPSPLPRQQLRTAATSQNAQKYKRKDQPSSSKKKKTRTTFLQPDLKNAIQFSLVDAMRYTSPLSSTC